MLQVGLPPSECRSARGMSQCLPSCKYHSSPEVSAIPVQRREKPELPCCATVVTMTKANELCSRSHTLASARTLVFSRLFSTFMANWWACNADSDFVQGDCAYASGKWNRHANSGGTHAHSLGLTLLSSFEKRSFTSYTSANCPSPIFRTTLHRSMCSPSPNF